MITRNDYQFSLKWRNFFKTTSERRILWRLKFETLFFEEVMITFQSENTFFITEGDDDHFLVIITLCPLLKSDEGKGDHYGVIYRHYGLITPHHRRKWSSLVSLPPITWQVMSLGDDQQSDDYVDSKKVEK